MTHLSSMDTNASVDDFPDRTGYECFLNSVNIDDYADDGHLEQAVLFVQRIFADWREIADNPALMAIITCDEWGAKVKFHASREGERWLASDLEGYEEKVMLVSSEEAQFAGTPHSPQSS